MLFPEARNPGLYSRARNTLQVQMNVNPMQSRFLDIGEAHAFDSR